MLATVNNAPSESHQKGKAVPASRAAGGDRDFPATREAWAEVFVTATRYF